MKTQILQPNDDGINIAADILKSGQVCAVPTETVYGLAANALDGAAVKRIFEAKGRPCDNPLIVHVSSVAEIAELVREIPHKAIKLFEKFAPGPLTIVLKKSAVVPFETSGGLDTVAVRIPKNETVRALIKACDFPLAAPSANKSGSPSPTTAEHVLCDLDGLIPAVIDGGACEVGLESTVLSLANNTPRLLRPGAVTQQMIEEVIGPVDVDKSVTGESESASAPGMKYKHYAPKTKLVLVEGTSKQFSEYVNKNKGEKTAVICFSEDETKGCERIVLGAENDEESCGQALFDALRKLDTLGCDIAFAHAPKKSGVGLAIYNRLLRAAAFEVVKFPFIVGVTGATGAGKTLLAKEFVRVGFAHLDADIIARQTVQIGKPALSALVKAFGEDILKADGSLNRAVLAKKAFADKTSTKRLNDTIFPFYLKELEGELSQIKADFILYDAPTLFESSSDKYCDMTIGLLCDEKVRKRRILARDGISEEMADLRIKAGKPDEFFEENCDITMRSDMNADEFEKIARHLAEEIKICHSEGEPRRISGKIEQQTSFCHCEE